MVRSKKRPSLDHSKAVAYLRVSTEDQSLGPEAQRAAIEAWAARQGVQVAAWHHDQGVSGAAAIEDRPGLLAALRDLEELGAAHLVVAKWDRVARDVMIAAMVERMAERQGARVVSADGVGAGDGPESSLMRSIVQAFAAYERALIRVRTKAAMKALRDRGQWCGEIPMGFHLAEDGKTLLDDPDERAAIRTARTLREQGKIWTFQRIADELMRQGYRPRGSRWHPMTIARMVQGCSK
jgi:DNA invertase Pin-like site-specific DNA recombinase